MKASRLLVGEIVSAIDAPNDRFEVVAEETEAGSVQVVNLKHKADRFPQIEVSSARFFKRVSALRIDVGTRVERTSVTGLVMVDTVEALKRIGSAMYAQLSNGALIPVAALRVSTREEAHQFVAECRASIKRLNDEVLRAIDRRDFTTADRLDRQREKLYSAAKAAGAAS